MLKPTPTFLCSMFYVDFYVEMSLCINCGVVRPQLREGGRAQKSPIPLSVLSPN